MLKRWFQLEMELYFRIIIHAFRWLRESNQLYSNNGESPTALLCYDDEIAEEAIEALAARGLNVPDDVSIVSFNDSSTGRNRGVSLTTMRLPIMQVGQAAGKVLLERIEDEELPYKVIKHKGELIVRGSTAKVTD